MAKKTAKNYEMIIGTSPVIIHVPHASSIIPDLALGSLEITEKEISQELLAMTDAHTDTFTMDICKSLGDSSPFAFINNISRLAVDPERFIGEQEEMNKAGMGAVYTHGSQGQVIRSDNEVVKARLIEEYYVPYARSMSFFVKNVLSIHKRAVILDLHSYASVALPYELHQQDERPEVCLGLDTFHTPELLKDKAQAIFEKAGYSVGINTPFKGTYVPDEFYGKDPTVMSLMMEIRRDTYMDETTGKVKADEYQKMKSAIEEVVKTLSSFHLPL